LNRRLNKKVDEVTRISTCECFYR